jgi:hypothetical protein
LAGKTFVLKRRFDENGFIGENDFAALSFRF